MNLLHPLKSVTMLEPVGDPSWSSLFSDKNLGNVTNWIDKGCNRHYYNSNTHLQQAVREHWKMTWQISEPVRF
ncbi:MAG: hypothetical protein ACLTZM_20095 [Ruminococcus sp.]